MHLPHRLLIAALLTPMLMSAAVLAQSTNRQIGTQFEVTADPLVTRPHGQPCVVTLFSNYTFALFSDTAKTFQFTPPTNCSGPWKKIVLEADFSENGGRQFDRTASMYIANTNMYFGTTPEPLPTLTNTWHVERDVTDYSALMRVPQQGTMILQNCTTDCPPPYNTLLTGVFTVNADLEFYPADDRGHEEGSKPADVVLPLVQINSSGDINLPANSANGVPFSTTFTLPTNIERAYLDVVSQSQSSDEQWFACFPDDLSSLIPLGYGCGHTDFRETEVTIDGTLAGIAPVSPWVYTGFLPDQWRPMPAAQTLDFVPYRVNLTPFAGLLSDGNPHTVTVSVFNDDFYFSMTASLLLYLDHGSTQVSGAVTQNTLTSPSPVVTENLQGTSTVTGTIGVTSNRQFTIAGYVNTSHGQVTTSVSQRQDFSGTQTIDFDTVNQSVLDQQTSVQTSVSSNTTASSNEGTVSTIENFSFPITVNLTFPVPAARFGFTVDTTQKYHTDRVIWFDGFPASFNSLTNSVAGSDVSPASSSQKYSYFDSEGQFYNCRITSTNNILTKVSEGCNPDEH